MIERLTPADRDAWLALRRDFLGASEIGALFDVHPYLTRYALWAEKSGLIAPTGRETSPMRRGRYIEQIAPLMLAEERPTWTVEPNIIGVGGFYIADRANRIGCTPDLICVDPERGSGVVQVKSASSHSFRRQWLDDDGAPVLSALDRAAGNHGSRLERRAMGSGAPDLRRRLRRARVRHRPVDRRHGGNRARGTIVLALRRDRPAAAARLRSRPRARQTPASRRPGTGRRGSISIPSSSAPATTSLPASARSACSRRASNAPKP